MVTIIEIILVAAALLVFIAACVFTVKKAAVYRKTKKEVESRVEVKKLVIASQNEVIQQRALDLNQKAALLQERIFVLQRSMIKMAVLGAALKEAKAEIKQLPRRFGF